MMISSCIRILPQLLICTFLLSACNSVPDSDCDIVLDDGTTAPSRSAGELQQLLVSLADEQQALEAALEGEVLTEQDASLFYTWSLGEQAVSGVVGSAEVEHIVWKDLVLAESEHLDSILTLCAECAVVNDLEWMAAITNLSMQGGLSELDALYSTAQVLEQDWLDKTELGLAELGALQALVDASKVATASHLTLVVYLIEASGVAYSPVLLMPDEYRYVLNFQ